MDNTVLLTRYNYDEFTPEKVVTCLRFQEGPPLGLTAPDYPLWAIVNGSETRLSQIWSQNLYTIVEFGSFT